MRKASAAGKIGWSAPLARALRGAAVGDLRRVMKLNRHQSLFKQGRIEASLDEHRQIMQALKDRLAEQQGRHQGGSKAMHVREGG